MNTKNYFAILAVIAVVLAGGAYAFSGSNSNQEAAVAQVPASTDTSPVSTTDMPENGATSSLVTRNFKDGTYTAQGEYKAPSGTEIITVGVTLKDDIITDATVMGTPVNPNSKRYQGQFISGYKEFVVGKLINEVNLSTVSGSSLTPVGFNAALDKIKIASKA